MANPILPDSKPQIRTHVFADGHGALLRIVDHGDGTRQPHLETLGGFFIGQCRATGPEILKLASEGLALWNALDNLVEAVAAREGLSPETLGDHDHAVGAALLILDATAQTFDYNEPEEPAAEPEAPTEPAVIDLMKELLE